jgi:hypothetical protein
MLLGLQQFQLAYWLFRKAASTDVTPHPPAEVCKQG